MSSVSLQCFQYIIWYFFPYTVPVPNTEDWKNAIDEQLLNTTSAPPSKKAMDAIFTCRNVINLMYFWYLAKLRQLLSLFAGFSKVVRLNQMTLVWSGQTNGNTGLVQLDLVSDLADQSVDGSDCVFPKLYLQYLIKLRTLSADL